MYVGPSTQKLRTSRREHLHKSKLLFYYEIKTIRVIFLPAKRIVSGKFSSELCDISKKNSVVS